MPAQTKATHTAETLKRSLQEMRDKLAALDGFLEDMKADGVDSLVVNAQSSLATAIVGLDRFSRECQRALRDWRLSHGVFGKSANEPRQKHTRQSKKPAKK